MTYNASLGTQQQKPQTKVVIVHGSYGSPKGNWFPWLKREIERQGKDAIVPKFPTPDNQNLESWKNVFRSESGALTSETIIVGHSVGAAFVLNLLEESPTPIRAAFLVAGFLGELGLPDYDHVNRTFVCKKLNWNEIKKNAKSIFIFHGDDDPYVPLSKGQAIAESLSAPLEVVAGGGHLNAESGYTTFPLLLNKLQPFLTATDTSSSSLA